MIWRVILSSRWNLSPMGCNIQTKRLSPTRCPRWEKVRTFCAALRNVVTRRLAIGAICRVACFFNTDEAHIQSTHAAELQLLQKTNSWFILRRKPAETGGDTSAARRQRQLDRRWRPSSIGSFPVPTEQVVTRAWSVVMSMLHEAERNRSQRPTPPMGVQVHMLMHMHMHMHMHICMSRF